MHDTSVEHTDSKATYLWVWAALLLLTAVEVVLAYKQILTPLHMLEVLLVLSVIKAGLITMYFMPASFAIRTHCAASNFTGLNWVANFS